ncbi:DMT family transporter [Candidatus Kaiserbacteria bacterium]|nr:DMT family transporter [Candidatus Kaiserbacteria bacterium]
MLWFLIALAGSLCYSSTNHIDKYLISKYLKGGEVGSLIIFSSIFSVFALPVVLFVRPEVFSVTLFQGIALALTGVMTVLAVLLYFYALHEDDASNVVPFYQTVPIFAFVLGYFVLGETITPVQAVASLIIIVGAAVLSLEFGKGTARFKKKVVFLMLSASVLYAVSSIVFKLVALEEGFWLSIFWSLVGKVILGGFFLTAIPPYREQFFTVLKENRVGVLALNSVNEILAICADALVSFATLLAPVALVLLAESFQPVFVLLIGVLLTIFLPHISKESLSKKALIQKSLAVGIIMLGTYLLTV